MTEFLSFGQWLQKRRMALDLTRAELAALADCSAATVRKIEADERRPSRELAACLAPHLALGLEAQDVFVQCARGQLSPAHLPQVVPLQAEHDMSLSHFDSAAPGLRSRARLPGLNALPPQATTLVGREEETRQVTALLTRPECRLVAILGMGGVGKTTLAAHAAREVASRFDAAIWRSLLNAPPLDEILRAWVHLLSRRQLAQLPPSLDERLHLLLDYLRAQRCLLVLDNCEAILQGGARAGRYRSGYEDYGQLLHWLAEQKHQSCLLLTSRERPQGLARLEREGQGGRAFDLAGLTAGAGRALLFAQGVETSAHLGDELVARYSGNPLALKLVADTIRELFGGDVAAFLGQETPLFDDIQEVLDQQFARLSPLERDLFIWLAVEREPQSLEALERNLAQPVSRGETLAALRALQRRSLVERPQGVPDAGDRGARFALQNVVTEYTTERLLATVYQEILNEQPVWLNRYALLKAQAKEYVRQNQERLLVQPLARRLEAGLGRVGLETTFKRILAQLRAETPLAPGYAAGNILNLLLHLGYDLRGYDFSRLAVWQAYLQGKAAQEVDFNHAYLSGGVFSDTFRAILSVAFSPDAAYLAAATGNGEVRLWEAAEGWASPSPFTVCVGHTGWVMSVCFSPDGRTLASGGDDQTVRLWDVQTGKCLCILQGHTARVMSVCFSPDGHTLVSSSDDQTVRLWDTQIGACLRTLQGHTGCVRSVRFSPDGHTLVSSSDDQTVRLWDAQTGNSLRILQEHTAWVWSVCFSPDGRTLASAGYDQTIRLWDVETGACLGALQGHTGWLLSVCFSPDGRTLASAGYDQTIRLWDVETLSCLHILQEHTSVTSSVYFNPDGRTLASGGNDQTVRLWDAQTGACLRTLQGYTAAIWSVCFSPHGRTVAGGSGDQTVRLWDVETGECLHILRGHAHWVRSVCFSPNGCTLASTSEDRTVRIWDAQTGACLHILRKHTLEVITAHFSPDNCTLASAGNDQTIRLWDVESGACLRTLQGHTGCVRSVCFSPDGRTLASGGDDQNVRLWDVQTGECLHILQRHMSWVWSVCFSPDGRTLANGSDDQTVRLWDVESGACLRILQGHTAWVMSVCFSPDGRTLASSSGDQTIRLWDVETGICLHVFQGHTSVIYSVCFSADGRTLASGSGDQTVRLWDVETGECLRILRSDRPYERMNITGATGLTAAQTTALKALGAVEFS